MKIGYPVKFIYKGDCFFTLYFDDDDKLLRREDKIICYSSLEELYDTHRNNYNIDKSIYIYIYNSILMR